MRIALFTDTYPPRVNGVATSVHILRNHLELMGHKVLIVTSADPDATEPVENVIRVMSIPFRTQRLATVAGPADYAEIARFDPDIIHTHSEFTMGIMGRFMAMTLKKTYVHTMHTAWEYYTKHIVDIDVLEPFMCQAARKYTAMVCNAAGKVIVPTSKIEDLLRTYKVRKEIVIIPTGIDIERFNPELTTPEQLREIRAELGLTEHDKILINIGRVEREKNITELLTSLSGYLRSHATVKFVIVGDGTARHELEGFAADLGIGEQVVFAGQRPRDEINRYYRLGDVFISASVSETQGLTYVEAMASGLPVVAKEDRCLENVLIEGENGFMFSDADSLIAAVDELLCDEAKRRRFCENATATAQKFSSKAYAENVLKLYEEILQGS